MTSTKILDHYRLSLVGDKNIFLVLSIISKSFVESERDIKNKTRISSEELGFIVAKLFRANLIKGDSKNGWSVTSLAEEALTSLGVSEIASKSIISEQQLNKADQAFFEACLSGNSTPNKSWTRDISAILRACDAAFRIASTKEPLKQEEKTRTLYALIIGTNPLARNTDIEAYCDSVSNWYESNYPDRSNKLGLLWQKDSKLKRSIYQNCWHGLEDYKSSNRLLLTEDKDIGKIGYLVTLARFLANASTERDTCELNWIYMLNNDIFAKGVDSVVAWEPFGNGAVNILAGHNANLQDWSNIYEFREKFIQQLKKSIRHDFSHSELSQQSCIDFPNVQVTYNKTITAINTLLRDIANGQLDSLSSDEKSEVIDALEEVSKSARQRLMSE